MEKYNRDLIVVMRHVRGNKMCSRGARAFCLAHNIDWDDFLNHGVKCGVLLDTNDAMAISLVRFAHGWK